MQDTGVHVRYELALKKASLALHFNADQLVNEKLNIASK